MEGFKEFQGRDLDDAIRQACDYFAVAREKLEIDIIRDSKSGIFGIVGVRKAMIKARRVQMRDTLGVALERDSPPAAQQEAAEAAPPAAGRNKGRARQEGKAAPVKKSETAKKPASAPKPAPVPDAPGEPDEEDEEGESQTMFLDKVPDAPAYSDFPLEARPAPRKSGQRARHAAARPQRERPAGKQAKHGEHAPQEVFSAKDAGDEGGADGLPELPLEELDAERLKSLTLETVRLLVSPVADDASYEMHLADSRVHVRIDCGEDSGMLIGREGQTLAAVQYLASRIVSRGMNAAVRVNLD
ncbi:MAG: Jag N-terminal domain-containing protein, partial [Deltaproteobacteria bacterium]|nr:Jag N-terminal domain-containing protein [Deltaproteobacteria bacterium]